MIEECEMMTAGTPCLSMCSHIITPITQEADHSWHTHWLHIKDYTFEF